MTDAPVSRLYATGRLVPADLDEAMVASVVQAFYARARVDPLLGPVFNRVVAADHWPEHIETITDFWSALLLNTRRYTGRPMPRHLAIPELDDTHFQRWLTLFRETAEELCPPHIAALFVERAERIGHNFRIRMAQMKGADPSAVAPQKA